MKALYRKYRSKKLAEIVGQEHVTSTLANALKNGSISHAYLFTGPRGVGKTSVARILAHEVNGLAYDEDATVLDIIEIDAASNRRIDEIRELRERAHNAPASAKYKVYIIDEVHMLTKEAFNALLKILEEPPAHVVFILATTEAHKLPDTIISRTQRFTFKPINHRKAIEHLRYIASKESMAISDRALELIARHGDGSFRDSISLLDQISNVSASIEEEDVRSILGIPPESAISDLADALIGGSPAQLIEALRVMSGQGYQASKIAKQLMVAMRSDLVKDATAESAVHKIDLLKQLVEVPASFDPETKLELSLLGFCLKNRSALDKSDKDNKGSNKSAEAAKKTVEPEKNTEPPKSAGKGSKTAVHRKTNREAHENSEQISTQATETFSAQFDEKTWGETLREIKKTHNTLYSMARMAVPEFSQGQITLAFKFPFHQKRLADDRNKKIVEEIIKKLTGENVKLICVVNSSLKLEPPAENQQVGDETRQHLTTISNIFGSAEVLE